MEVSEPWFSALISGEKKVEGRKAKPKWNCLVSGDIISVFCGDNVSLFKIIRVTIYPDVRSYLQTEGLQNCLPGINNLEEGVQIYEELIGKDELAKFKFLGIEMKLVE